MANRCVDGLCASTVGVLLGNGDGTFQTALNFDPGGFSSRSLTVRDVSGDGKLDVEVANEIGGVGVLINTTPSPYKAFVQQPINPDQHLRNRSRSSGVRA